MLFHQFSIGDIIETIAFEIDVLKDRVSKMENYLLDNINLRKKLEELDKPTK